MTKEEAKQKIAELVKKYEKLTARELNQYSHNEEATKLNFIMPLFTALGWDFQNNNEVTAEEKASNGRVDYAFKLKNVTQLCLEAKPLKADINSENYKKQAIDYAYYKAVTWAALTNFEELRLFNAQKKDNFIILTHDKYIQEFDDLWLFSKESFETGLLKAKATKYGVLSPPPRIETLLYTDLREWRGQLYNQLHQHNATLKPYEIDEVIQKFFNRLIFIRTCEDKGLEGNQLLEVVREWEKGGHKGELVEKVKQIFQNYNQWYDSELFAEHLLDSDKVFIEGPTVEAILKGMANYAFDLIDADVLGAVYEQYLGFVAAETKEKPQEQQKMALGLAGDTTFTIVNKKQHRKEQGIYYTPRFVTDYIVKETVGRFIKEHNANEIFNIKILDPACGSGSFLIRAYDELLTYYADDQHKTVAHLDQYDRLPVLKRNIFGVDLDRQAVEIARLNLLIRSLAQREILPGLKDNIKQGNSLISGTPDTLKGYFGDNWEAKKPFNWDEEFRDITRNGGFDVVIGNPPYGADFDENDRKYIAENYPNSKNNKNSAMVFIERALNLTKEGGYFSFIIPKSLAFSQSWASGRKLILERLGYAYDTSKAFKEVLLEQMVIVVSQKFKRQTFYEAAFLDEEGTKETVKITKELSTVTDSILLGVTEQEIRIFNKMNESKLFMGDISTTSRGLPFQKYLKENQNGVPIYRGDHISRYGLRKTTETIPVSVLSEAEKKISYLKQTKILSQQIIAHVQNPTDHIILMSTLDKDGVITLDTVQNTILTDNRFSYELIIGLLNSYLWSWYAYRFIYSKAIRTMHFDDYYMSKFPLPILSIRNPVEELIARTNKMLELYKKLAPVRDTYSNERDDLLKEIAKTDKQIDNLVYDLYGLTAEERKIIEEEIK